MEGGHVSITEGGTEGCAGWYCRRCIGDGGSEECEDMWSGPKMETKINSGTRSKDLIANHSLSRSLTTSTQIIITLTKRREGAQHPAPQRALERLSQSSYPVNTLSYHTPELPVRQPSFQLTPTKSNPTPNLRESHPGRPASNS